MRTPCTLMSRSDNSSCQVGALHAHPDGEVFGGGVEFVKVVLPLIEVVSYLFVGHGDGSPNPELKPVPSELRSSVAGGQLRGGQSVALVQVDHRPRDRGVCTDDVGDLGHVHVDADVAIQRHFPQLGDQPGVVLRSEERGIDAEHLGDAHQYRDGQRSHVVLDLIQIAGGDVEHLRQRGLAKATLAAELPNPRSDEGFGHVSRASNVVQSAIFASLAATVAVAVSEFRGVAAGGPSVGLASGLAKVDNARPRSAPRRLRPRRGPCGSPTSTARAG